tara:strand:- start:256 stop:867 length:612 start_codon:yes stop_codon:yes gene_type:complete
MDVHKLCDEIKPILDKYKNDKYVEMEFRLGKFNGTFFDTNVGKDAFYKFKEGLEIYTGWEKIVNSSCEVYYRNNHNNRLTIDQTTEEDTLICKEKVFTQDFKHLNKSPYDIRFNVSHEIPIEDTGDNQWDRNKIKERFSYIRKNLSIDMTICSGMVQDMDAEDSHTYQVEFEIIEPNKVDDIDTLFKIIHKIKDFFNMSNYIC